MGWLGAACRWEEGIGAQQGQQWVLARGSQCPGSRALRWPLPVGSSCAGTELRPWCQVRHKINGFIYECRSRKKKIPLGARFQSLSSLKLSGGFAEHLCAPALRSSELQQTLGEETSSSAASTWELEESRATFVILELWSLWKRIVKWSFHA